MIEPIQIHITVTMDGDEKITEADLKEVRRLAEADDCLNDDNALSDLFNELVETKVNPEWMEWDFDWSGPQWGLLLDAIRHTEPAPIPEIVGQTQTAT